MKFKKQAYIRIGATTKLLNQHPEYEKRLWQKFETINFEQAVALNNINSADVFKFLNFQEYCELKKIQLDFSDLNIKLILENLESDQLIEKHNKKYAITNLGALLLARDINDFDHYLVNKIPRLIFYKDNSRIYASQEIEITEGYITAIPKIVDYIHRILPTDEKIDLVFRTTATLYPPDAIRELIVNALMHQDFSMTGMYPMIEVFKSRIEIRNPGLPSIDVKRFVDIASNCKNVYLARILRILNFCEERGMGIDKVINLCETFNLPAPNFKVNTISTTAILYSKQEFQDMKKENKIWATYMHACLKYVNGDYANNESLRKRFNIKSEKYTQVSKIIKQTIEAQLIKKYDGSASPRDMKYVPIWA